MWPHLEASDPLVLPELSAVLEPVQRGRRVPHGRTPELDRHAGRSGVELPRHPLGTQPLRGERCRAQPAGVSATQGAGQGGAEGAGHGE